MADDANVTGVAEAVTKAGTKTLGAVASTGMDAVVTALKGISEIKGAAADVAEIGIDAGDRSVDAMLRRAEALMHDLNAFVQRTLGNE